MASGQSEFQRFRDSVLVVEQSLRELCHPLEQFLSTVGDLERAVVGDPEKAQLVTAAKRHATQFVECMDRVRLGPALEAIDHAEAFSEVAGVLIQTSGGQHG